MPTHSETKDRLLTLLKRKSVFHGEFILTSGEKSTYYVDCKLTTLDPEGATLVGQVMLSLIFEEMARSGSSVEGVGGLTLGADPIALAVAIRSFQERPQAPLQCLIVRKTPKSHGQARLIEGNFKPGTRVVVIDDVITKGDSTLKAIDAIEQEGGKVAFVAVLVDRQQGGREKIEQRGFKVVSAFTREQVLERKPAP